MKSDPTAGPSRRDFLVAGGLGLVAATQGAAAAAQGPAAGGANAGNAPQTSPVILPSMKADTEAQAGNPFDPLPPSKRLGVAVVGLGELSLQEILPAFGQCRYVKLAALVSGDPAKASKVADQYGVGADHLYDYKNFDRIAQDPAVDVVYVVLPNSMHMEYTVRAARAGKHVLCEKPMANSVAECEQMIAACESARKQLMIAYRCQYEPYNREMIRIARSGEYGTIRLIEAVNGQNQATNNQWRHKKALAGGGSLPDVGLYCLNATRYITGLEPVQVTAQILSDESDPRFTEVEDRVNFQFKFPTGILASCQTFYSAHETRKCSVLFEKARLDLAPAFAYRGLKMMIAAAKGMAEITQEVKLPEKSHFALEMDHMGERILQNTKNHTPGEEGLQDMKIVEAIYLAARSGKPVDLPHVQGYDTTRGLAPARSS